jgi:hypothetical protein
MRAALGDGPIIASTYSVAELVLNERRIERLFGKTVRDFDQGAILGTRMHH